MHCRQAAWLEEASHAFFEHYDFVCDAGGAGFSIEQLQRLVHRFMGQAEAAVMHGNHPASFEVQEGLHSIGGTGVHVAELRRIVGAERKKSEWGKETASISGKTEKVCVTPRVKKGFLSFFHNDPAVAAMRI